MRTIFIYLFYVHSFPQVCLSNTLYLSETEEDNIYEEVCSLVVEYHPVVVDNALKIIVA